jgi:DNA invertase Pin-like site-specific DNA recombinase
MQIAQRAASGTLKVVGYVRVSSAEQADSGAGLAAQRAAITAECAAKGWELVGIEEDAGVSAKSTVKRPGLARALSAVETHEADILMVSKLDRLSRSVADFVALLSRSQKAEWKLVCLDLGLDTSTPMGEFAAHIIAAVAQLERRLIGQRTADALAEVRRTKGIKLGRERLIDEDVVDRVRALRADGLSLRAVASRLDQEGYRTPSGNPWRASTLQSLLARA